MGILEQYNRIDPTETDANAALTTRTIRDLADGISNAKYYAQAPKTHSYVLIPALKSISGSTDDKVLLGFAPRYLPGEFNEYVWSITHKRIAGTGTTTWNLRSLIAPYTTTETYGAPFGGIGVKSVVLVTDSGSVVRSTGLGGGLPALIDNAWHMVLTAQNSDGTTQSEIYTIDITPRFKGADDMAYVQILDLVATGSYTTTSSSYADINAEFENQVTISQAGTYRFQLHIAAFVATATSAVNWRVLEDGTAITDDDRRFSTSLDSNGTIVHDTMVFFRELNVGQFTYKVQWKRLSGSGTVTMDTNCFIKLDAVRVG